MKPNIWQSFFSPCFIHLHLDLHVQWFRICATWLVNSSSYFSIVPSDGFSYHAVFIIKVLLSPFPYSYLFKNWFCFTTTYISILISPVKLKKMVWSINLFHISCWTYICWQSSTYLHYHFAVSHMIYVLIKLNQMAIFQRLSHLNHTIS